MLAEEPKFVTIAHEADPRNPPKDFKKPVYINGKDWVDLTWAKSSCHHCHGTGVWGTRLLQNGQRGQIVCSCVGKVYLAWNKKPIDQAAS